MVVPSPLFPSFPKPIFITIFSNFGPINLFLKESFLERSLLVGENSEIYLHRALTVLRNEGLNPYVTYEIQARDGEVIGLIDKDDENTAKLLSNYLTIESHNFYLDPILYAIQLQLVSLYSSLRLKINPDRPRNLAKTVTVE